MRDFRHVDYRDKQREHGQMSIFFHTKALVMIILYMPFKKDIL